MRNHDYSFERSLIER